MLPTPTIYNKVFLYFNLMLIEKIFCYPKQIIIYLITIMEKCILIWTLELFLVGFKNIDQ